MICIECQPLLSSIVNNKYEGKIGKKKCQEFGKWYNDYRKVNPSESFPTKINPIIKYFNALKD